MTKDAYQAALDYLFAATDYEKMQRVRYNADTFSLDRMRQYLARLGSPERRFGSVHVAGTKGKGSTAAMVHAMAGAAGLVSGLYTSPHLVDLRERIRIGSREIAPEDLRQLIETVRPSVDALREAGDPPTFFEIFTGLAFRHFADRGVDLAVVEVGLGGRLDATNVLVPHVAVITALSLDHTFQLGGTLAAIAAEKAGIIKPGVPVVVHPQPPEAMAVVEGAARAVGAPILGVGREVTYAWQPAEQGGRRGGRRTVTTPRGTYPDLFIPLMGEHQAANAAAAVAAAEAVPALAARLTPDLAAQALAAVEWPGRMEYVAGTPERVLDGAHNRESVERLLAAMDRHFPRRPLTVLFASAADKDVDGMLAALAAGCQVAEVVFTRTDNPRACDPAELQERWRRLGREGRAVATSAEALAVAAEAAGPKGLVVVCGSLYLVGEVKRLSAGGAR